MIGVLALQGDFTSHIELLHSLNVDAVPVRYPSQLKNLEGIVLPGGESSVQKKLLLTHGLYSPLISFLQKKPCLATCAGLIFLAQEKILDVEVERNAYGPQLYSKRGCLVLDKNKKILEALFIRAPKVIKLLSKDIQVIARHKHDIVALLQKNLLALTCHPELLQTTYFHELFLSLRS